MANEESVYQEKRKRFWFAIWCVLLVADTAIVGEMVIHGLPGHPVVHRLWLIAATIITGWALYEVLTRWKRL